MDIEQASSIGRSDIFKVATCDLEPWPPPQVRDELTRRIEALEQRYDGHIRVVFDAIRKLMAPPPITPLEKGIGFETREK